MPPAHAPHPEVVAALAFIEALDLPPIETTDPATAREQRKAMVRPSREECHEMLDVDALGVRARLYRAAPSTVTPGLLVWYHGGGWVFGDLDSHDGVCISLCNRTGHSVLSIDYRLAPEDPFPAGLDDCINATRWAHANATELGVDPDRLAVGGDSAGGNLAAVVCHIAPVPIRFQVLVYPVTDARANLASYTDHSDDGFLSSTSMRCFVDHYLSGGHGSVDDPRVSPLLAADDVLAATPPALVITAEFDPLRDDGAAYAKRLIDLGVATSHVHFTGQTHGFFSAADIFCDGRLAHAVVAEALTIALQ